VPLTVVRCPGGQVTLQPIPRQDVCWHVSFTHGPVCAPPPDPVFWYWPPKSNGDEASM
jgi:hypothetical protein